MLHRFTHVALSAILVLLLALGLVYSRNSEPDDAARLPPVPDLAIDGPTTVLQGETAAFTAASDAGDVTTVEWRARSDAFHSGTGARFEFAAENLGEVSVTAELPAGFGRVSRVTATLTVEPNPLDFDDDGDGLDNRTEDALGTSRNDPDTDGDGLDDPFEVDLGTDPTRRDSDGDALPDGYELAFRTDALVDSSSSDTDGDGHTDTDEYAAGTNPRNDRFYPDGPAPTSFVPNGDVAVGAEGVELEFRMTGATTSTTSVAAWTGLWYAEITATGTKSISFGVASPPGEEESPGPLLAVSVAPGETAGLIVDARTDTVGGWPVTEEDGIPIVGDRIDGAAFSELVLVVRGPAEATATVNAGDDPFRSPLEYGAHYLLYNAGEAAAEFMAFGWASANEYRSRETPEQFDAVRFVIDEHTGHGVNISRSGVRASYDEDDRRKRAVIANQGMIGEFRYWEATRLWPVPIGNGQGILTEYSILDPYPGAVGDAGPSQPGVSVNSLQNVWQYPVAIAQYDTSNTVYGFAVDYRGDRPIVHVIIGRELIVSVTLDVFLPVHPALYGTPLQSGWMQEANFGTKDFVYDAAAILADAGIDTTGFELGWGVHDGSPPAVLALEDE